MSGQLFGNRYKIVFGQVSPEDILVDATNYPASGSFIDVTGYERIACLVHFGAINAGSTMTFELRQAESLTGTPDVIDATYCKITTANDDDDQALLFELETDKLATDHHFLTLQVEGTIASNNYADITFFLDADKKPVTQNAAVFVSGNQVAYVG